MPDTDDLKEAILEALCQQGYVIQSDAIRLPNDSDKETLRRVQALAVAKKLAVSEPGLRRYEDRLLSYIADGSEVQPQLIAPRLAMVERGTENELLFRYGTLHWSVPVSSGYGRRLRFLVFDESNGKLIGLFGLGDPVFALRARDRWIGWSTEARKRNLYHVMDAYVLGAVPPYSSLLAGKLIALLVLSNEVRKAFRRKYKDSRSLIGRKTRPAYLAAVTTTSALGRSSLYNRIRVDGFDYWRGIGFTSGSGDFHFSNGVYQHVRAFVEKHCQPTAKNPAWGSGFRNKREVIKKCLTGIGLSTDLIYHGIRREVFVAPLGRSALRFLQGGVSRPGFHDWPAAELARIWNERWLLPRTTRDQSFRSFRREEYRLWPSTTTK